jgi:hypothetical protein
MEIAKNLVVICQFEDGAYSCTVSIFDDWSKTWEENVPYAARSGDPAPVNVWILEQIATGTYNPIDACPLPPPPPTPPLGEAPTVI